MAAACQEFPSEATLQELISSFPREWQGLFAALNVKECLVINSGTKWLRDNLSSVQKNFILPHWPDLVHSLCLPFPLVLNQQVIFQPKFACFTLKLQRNMLCFIVYHSESIPVDDIKVLLSMLVKLPQMKYTWYKALVATLQGKVNCLEASNTDFRKLESSVLDMNKTRTVKISECCISKMSKTRLDNLCSKINTSIAGCCLLNGKLEPIANQYGGQIDAVESNKVKKNESECSDLVVHMEADQSIQSDVIEIFDDSPVVSCGSMEIPDPPDFSTQHESKVDITVHSPLVLSSIIIDHSTSPTTSLIAPLPEVPHHPELEIEPPNVNETINMEVKPSEGDAFMNKYINIKNHLRSSEDLDVELVQEFLSCFLENTPKALVRICKFLEMDKIPETSIVMLIRQFLLLEKDCSFQATVIFAEHCIGLWLGTLQQAGSRNLLAGMAAFTEKHPKAFVDGVMVQQFYTTSLLWPQCDLIIKVAKKFEKEMFQYFMEKLLQSNEMNSLIWNEHMIVLLSAVLEKRLDLNVSVFEKFVNCLQFQSLPLASSLKFAKLVLTIINKYGSLVKPRLSSFKQILEENNTFLKKSGLTALKKMED